MLYNFLIIKNKILPCSCDVYNTWVRYKILFFTTSLKWYYDITITHCYFSKIKMQTNMQFTICKYLFFFRKEIILYKKLYNFILKNINLFMILKNWFIQKIYFIIIYLFSDHITFIWNIFLYFLYFLRYFRILRVSFIHLVWISWILNFYLFLYKLNYKFKLI